MAGCSATTPPHCSRSSSTTRRRTRMAPACGRPTAVPPPTRRAISISSPATARSMPTPAARTTATRSSKSARAGAVVDYFTPHNQANINANNFDLGAAGPLLLPDQPGAHPHLIVERRQGQHDLPRRPRRDGALQLEQRQSDRAVAGQHLPVRHARARKLQLTRLLQRSRVLRTDRGHDSGVLADQRAALDDPDLSVADHLLVSRRSASGFREWKYERHCLGDSAQRRLRRASHLRIGRPWRFAGPTTRPTWESSCTRAISPVHRDALDFAAKFSVPLVVNGKVFVTTIGRLTIYGLLP